MGLLVAFGENSGSSGVEGLGFSGVLESCHAATAQDP